MARVELTVGYQEKHKVVVNVSNWNRSTDVWIDGKKVPDGELNRSVYAPDYTFSNLTLSIGEGERHEMKIAFGRLMWSGFSIQVDGRDVYQWKLFGTKAEPYGYGISDPERFPGKSMTQKHFVNSVPVSEPRPDLAD